MEEISPIVELAEWLDTPAGRYASAWEQSQFDAAVSDVFGYHAVQLGLAQLPLLRDNRIVFKAYAGWAAPSAEPAVHWQASVLAHPEALPFKSQSIDLLVLPHALECTDAPHQVLREVERVLMPEGRVVISGFNPWSLWGARNRIPGLDPWLPHPPSAQVSLPRLKDWLNLLSFEVDRGRFGCYVPPVRSAQWIERWNFLESAGERWWPVCGAVYVVSAIKRVSGMRLIGSAWKTAQARARVAPIVAQSPMHSATAHSMLGKDRTCGKKLCKK